MQTRLPMIDREKIGISYRGGGPLLLIELGVAKACVELGIIPDVIAGVSAGAICAVAHALDPVHGTGIEATIHALKEVRNSSLGLTPLQVGGRLAWKRSRIDSLGENGPEVMRIAKEVLGENIDMTVGEFGEKGRPKLIIGATDLTRGHPVFFDKDSKITDALTASSAIPGIFPPKEMKVGGVDRILVDGGVSTIQPLSVLLDEGCGTILVCSVGYDGGEVAPPANALDTVIKSLNIMQYQNFLLERELVGAAMGDEGDILHLHLNVPFPIQGFDFFPDMVDKIIEESRKAAVEWITTHQTLPPALSLNSSQGFAVSRQIPARKAREILAEESELTLS